VLLAEGSASGRQTIISQYAWKASSSDHPLQPGQAANQAAGSSAGTLSGQHAWVAVHPLGKVAVAPTVKSACSHLTGFQSWGEECGWGSLVPGGMLGALPAWHGGGSDTGPPIFQRLQISFVYVNTWA
jgi:hypothetical protein